MGVPPKLTRHPNARRLLGAEDPDIEVVLRRPRLGPLPLRVQDPWPPMQRLLYRAYQAEDDEAAADRRQWRARRQDGGANRPLEVSKYAGYPVLKPPGGVAASKLSNYPVLSPPGGVAASKLVSYVVLQTLPSPPAWGFARAAFRIISSDDSADWVAIRPRWVRQPMLGPPPPLPTGAPSRWQLRIIQADDSADWQPIYRRFTAQSPEEVRAARPPMARLLGLVEDDAPAARLRTAYAQGFPPPASAAPSMARLRAAEPLEDDVLPITWGRRRAYTAPAALAVGSSPIVWVNT